MKRSRLMLKRIKAKEKGQAMVEAALVIPLFIMILVGIIDFGWIYSHQLVVNNLSRDGARYAVVHYGEANLEALVTSHVEGITTVIDPDDLSVSLESAGGDVGMCMIDNTCLNNYYALPNKLFEYIAAGVPVIVSDLPQMSAVVKQYQIGAVVPENDKDRAVTILRKWEDDPHLYTALKKNCRIASAELNWEKEFKEIGPNFR